MATGRGTAAALLLGLALAGCAHTRGGGAVPEAPAAHPVGAPRGGSRTASPSTPAPGSPSAGRLDPSEEITPEELATIPEPVPASQQGDSGAAAGIPTPAPGSPPREAQDAPDSAFRRDPAAVQPAGWVWRVQIFASNDLSEADRQAKDAAAKLGLVAHIEWENPLYKVRLGDFQSEAEAQDLRERAIRSGYPGAFRIRCLADTTATNE